jgi:methylmalonyl-CoA/ethylmalonyl-CoA epimerase
MASIQRIDNVGIAVTNLERSLTFYRRLGFEVEERWEEPPSASLVAGAARLWVFETAAREAVERTPEMMGNPPGLDHLSLWVGDVDAAFDRLRGSLRFEAEPADQIWGARAASLLDPDGTRIFLLGELRR